MTTCKSFIYLLFGTGVAISSLSCQKQLNEVVPQDKISTALALTNADAAQTLYTGVYADFRSYTGTFFALGEMRSEIWTDGLFTESLDGGYQQLYDQNISALNAPYGNWAGSLYNLMYQINNVIDIFPKCPLPVDQRNRELAEMYGLRAYLYYTLLKTWGAVPLVTQPVRTIGTPIETYKPRSSRDSVMLQIKNDIEQSLTLFNGDNSLATGARAYWNRLATLTLKGDVNSWSATLLGGGSADLNSAKAALQEVIDLQGATLQLDAHYADIFDAGKKSNNPEIIFATNYDLNNQLGVFSEFTVNNIQANTLSFSQASTPTVSSVYPYVGGANRVGMNQDMISKLTSGPADQRISGTFRIMYSSTAPYAIRGVMLTKWVGSTSGTSQVYNSDFPIYRYADVLLLMAEVKAKLGQDPSAEINAIRARAYGSSYTPYVSGAIDNNMRAVLEEQLREFIGEGKRWWALRRAGDKWVYAYINPQYLSPATVASGHGPTPELPLTTDMLNQYPLLTQTPGYDGSTEPYSGGN